MTQIKVFFLQKKRVKNQTSPSLVRFEEVSSWGFCFFENFDVNQTLELVARLVKLAFESLNSQESFDLVLQAQRAHC